MLYSHSEGPKIKLARLLFLLGDMPIKAITCLMFWSISFSQAITSPSLAFVRVMIMDFLVMNMVGKYSCKMEICCINQDLTVWLSFHNHTGCKKIIDN